MAKVALPYSARLGDAVMKLGTLNGLRIPDPDIAAMPRLDNTETEAYMDKHAAVREMLQSGIIKKISESRYEKAKKALLAIMPEVTKVPVGTNNSWNFGNVAINVRTQSGASRLDRQKVLSFLMVKQKMALADAEDAIKEMSTISADALYFTPSTVSE